MSQSSKVRFNTGALQVDGVDSIGAQAAAVADAAAATVTALTDSSTGTADGTVADVGASFNQTTLNNNMAEFATEINALVADVADIRTQVNDILAKLRTHGLIAE